jgi:hypothetical protein
VFKPDLKDEPIKNITLWGSPVILRKMSSWVRGLHQRIAHSRPMSMSIVKGGKLPMDRVQCVLNKMCIGDNLPNFNELLEVFHK